MEGPRAEGTTVDIVAIANQQRFMLSQLPATHALSGCDNVSVLMIRKGHRHRNPKEWCSTALIGCIILGHR